MLKTQQIVWIISKGAFSVTSKYFDLDKAYFGTNEILKYAFRNAIPKPLVSAFVVQWFVVSLALLWYFDFNLI